MWTATRMSISPQKRSSSLASVNADSGSGSSGSQEAAVSSKPSKEIAFEQRSRAAAMAPMKAAPETSAGASIGTMKSRNSDSAGPEAAASSPSASKATSTGSTRSDSDAGGRAP